MDLIRKMSSGLRSSQDLSVALGGESNGTEDAERREDVLEQEDGDVYEDAAATPGQHQQERAGSTNDGKKDAGAPSIRVRAPVSDENEEPVFDENEDPMSEAEDLDDDGNEGGGEEEDGEDFENEAGGEEEDGGASYRSGESFDSAVAPSIRVRARVSDDTEELDNDENEAGGEEEGEASDGSGESFDSALERMAASSSASSPKTSSPVGSLTGPAVLGNPPSVMSVSQQGALMRLNSMLIGDDSLDTSVIDNSTEEKFQRRLADLAESRGKSFDDASFESILDALLPLVIEKSETKPSDLKSENANSTIDASEGVDKQLTGAESPAAKTVAPTEEQSYDTGNNDIYVESQERNGSPENGNHGHDLEVEKSNDKEISDVRVQKETAQGAPLRFDLEQASRAYNSMENGDQDDDLDAESGDDEEMSDTKLQKEIGQEAPASTHSEQAPKAFVSSSPEVNDGKDVGLEELGNGEESEGDDQDEAVSLDGSDDSGVVPEEVGESAKALAMPKAKLTVEDEEEPKELEEEEPKELEDEEAKDLEDDEEAKEVGDSTEDSPELADETQAMPIAKLSEDDTDLTGGRDDRADSQGDEAVQEKLPESKSFSSEALEEGSVVTETPKEAPTVEEEIFKVLPQAQIEEEHKTIPANADEPDDADEAGEWDEEIEEDEEEDVEAEMEMSTALAALVRAADSPADDGMADIPSLGAAGPSLPARPTRTGRSSAPSLEPAPRAVQQPRRSAAGPPQTARSADDSQTNGEVADGNEETRENLQAIRVKFLRLALRLGQPATNVVVQQVLYRLGLAEQLRGGRGNSRNGGFNFDRASAIAEEHESAGPEELDFTCTIMLLGKTGVGKSATINSIFDEAKTGTNAFSPSTNKVQVITGHVHGIKVRIIDTPGLLPSVADQRHNEKVMGSVRKFISKQAPDIVLYFDRLDMQSRDYGDLPLLRTITDTFGAAVWFNAIVVLTHASSAPPDGPNGLPLSYEMFVAQRSHVVQQTIRQAAGDMRLMNPVSLVENHPACRVNRSRQRVLPNGQVWKPQLLLLCFASKILAEANSLLKLQDSATGKPFGGRSRAPPLPFLLSSLLQSRAQLRLPDEQMGEEDESDEELEEDEDSDEEEDYDQLPPFRRLAKEEVAELDEENRSNYFEELAERERLFQKKQWKEEKKRRRELKKRMAEAPLDQSQFVDEGMEDDMSRSAAVPVPMPDMVLPPSFDSDNPSHRYRYLETANQWLVRPVLETHGWDHDNGYDGMSVEKMFVVGDKIPASVSGQITKDKKDANLNMECAASLKHGEGKSTLAGLDLQTVGKDTAYTLRSETRFSNFKGNKTTGGLAMTLLGDTVSAGLKIEDRLNIGKRVKVVLNGGAITGRGDVAYGGSLEATLRDQDYPLSRALSSLGLSIMDWHGDLAIGGNLQSQFVIGKTMMVGRANLNNRGAGQISIRASSSEQLQMALIGLLPIIRSLANRLLGSQAQQ